MNTLRNELKRSYSQIPNELITDLTLSAGALRVLLYLFTKPDDWNVYNKDICKQLNINEKTLTRYWKQLLESQWLRRDKEQDKHGKFVSGGFLYRIGNFTVSDKIPESDILSESDKSNEHSNTKPITKNKLNTNTKDIVVQNKEIISASEQSSIKIAEYLDAKIKTVQPTFINTNIKGWAKDIEKAIRIDNRSEDGLINAINWVYTKEGSFWISNIQSGKKLREQFDKLEMQAKTKFIKNATIEERSGVSASVLRDQMIGVSHD